MKKIVTLLKEKGIKTNDTTYQFTENNTVKNQFTHFNVEGNKFWIGCWSPRFSMFMGYLKWSEMKPEWKEEFLKLIEEGKFKEQQ